MAETVNNSMPFAECPHCYTETQIDDWYDFQVGHQRVCPNCKKVMHVASVEAIMHITFSTEKQ